MIPSTLVGKPPVPPAAGWIDASTIVSLPNLIRSHVVLFFAQRGCLAALILDPRIHLGRVPHGLAHQGPAKLLDARARPTTAHGPKLSPRLGGPERHDGRDDEGDDHDDDKQDEFHWWPFRRGWPS